MDNNEYGKYIGPFLPFAFNNIFIIDMMSDLVMEFNFSSDGFICNKTIPFTNFYSDLEKSIHPEDLKGYVDSITSSYLLDNLKKGIEHITYEYRNKNSDGSYASKRIVTKLLEVNQKRLAIVLVENGCSEKSVLNNNVNEVENNKAVVFDAVANAIIKLNNVVNIKLGSSDSEVKSFANYINEVLVDLINLFPELTKALSDNMISSTNQGTAKTLLIVDDDLVTCKLLTKTFEDSYKILIANNGKEAIDILEKNNDVSDIRGKDKIVGMFLDLNMPIVDGFGVLDYMTEKNLLTKMPVIMISGDYDQATKERAYLYKIDDVLEKPFNVQVVKHRIKTFVNLYKTNNSLNEIILTQHQEIKNVLRTMTKSYLQDYSDDIRKISSYVKIIATSLKDNYSEYKLDENRINKMVDASRYYNIGMYALPKKIFVKDEYNDEEMKIIKGHPMIGISIFNSVLYQTNDNIFNCYAKEIIEYHEENYDGTGYPHGYSKDKIPVSALITSLAVYYNKLIKKITPEQALEEIKNLSDTKFNPQIVDCFVKNFESIKNIK